MKFYQWMIKTHKYRQNSLGILTRAIIRRYSKYPDFPKPEQRSRLRLRKFLLRHDSKLRGIEVFDAIHMGYLVEKSCLKWVE